MVAAMSDVTVVDKPSGALYADRRLAAAVIVSALGDLRSEVDLDRISARRFIFDERPGSRFEAFAQCCGYDAEALRAGILDRLVDDQLLEVVRYRGGHPRRAPGIPGRTSEAGAPGTNLRVEKEEHARRS